MHSRNHEQRVSDYMREITEIATANLDRRDLLKLGLVAGSSGAAALAGARGFRPYWAHASDLQIVSPPNRFPFTEPLPIPEVMEPVTLNPQPTRGPNPNPSTYKNFREAARPNHQRWTQFGGSETAPGFSGVQYESIEKAISHDFYPRQNGYPPSTIWTFVERSTGRAGPLRVKARYGQPVVHRIHNDLPAENGGFGINQTSTHLHNGHHASESDGGPTQFYDAGQFKDFHYPNVRAGFSRTHPETTLNGRTVAGDFRETLGFCWFHDHRFDFTSQNVYKGLVAFYTISSADIDLDTDDETTGLRLPSGEFDIPMVFADKAFDPSTGQLFFDLFNLDGILGDQYTVNGKIQPFLEVKKRKYRFRLLDGGPSRFYEFFLSNGQPFVQISNDGNLLPAPLTRGSIRVGVAERPDVIVDFSRARVGDVIYLQNRLEQTSGRGPTGKIIAPTNILQFRVVGPDVVADPSRIPTRLLELPARRPITQTREWTFDRSNGAWTINDKFFDPDVISAFIRRDTAEIWNLKSGGGWAHPVHVHLEEFQALNRDGKPVPAEEVARKDILNIGQAALGTEGTGRASVFLQFRDFLGDYPMHCHNTVHEDHAMMVRFQVVE